MFYIYNYKYTPLPCEYEFITFYSSHKWTHTTCFTEHINRVCVCLYIKWLIPFLSLCLYNLLREKNQAFYTEPLYFLQVYDYQQTVNEKLIKYWLRRRWKVKLKGVWKTFYWLNFELYYLWPLTNITWFNSKWVVQSIS